jgi:putative ABC transport system permease protein
VLLTGGLLMVRSFLAMRQVNPGFRVENVSAADLNLPGLRYAAAESRLAFYERLLERVRALPGVEQAAGISFIPIGGPNLTGNFSIEGSTLPEDAESAHQTVVTPGYFRAMGIAVLRGRDFRESDRAGRERVAIINQRLAELHFGADDPVGRRIALGAGQDVDWMTIIGVAGNINQRDINQISAEPEIYRPFAQAAGRGLSLVLRSALPLGALVPLIRQEVQSLDPEIPVFNATTMKQVVHSATWDAKFNSVLFGAFAAVALLLAAVGLYGVIAYTVVQRRQEFGLRIALGAQPRAVLRMVLGQSLVLVGIGLGLGLAGAFAIAQVMAGLLFGVSGRDPLTFATVPVLLVLVAAMASYAPARRALRVDPMTALRLD